LVYSDTLNAHGGDISRVRKEKGISMPTLKEINDLATEMHNKKIINLDLTGRELLSLKSSTLHVSKGEEAGIYVLGGDHYVIVCGSVNRGGAVVNPAGIQGPQ
jgi:hypothetical protein